MLCENECHRVCSRSGSGNRRIVLVVVTPSHEILITQKKFCHTSRTN